VANLASFRSAQSVDRSVHVLVRAGIADSFHLVEHGQVQLAGRPRGALGGCAAHVDAAGRGQAVDVCRRQRAGRVTAKASTPSAAEGDSV